jgi:hypothetical protein
LAVFGPIKGWVDVQAKLVGKSHSEARDSLDELEEDILWTLLVLDATLDACRLDDLVDELVNEELFSLPPQLARRAVKKKVLIFNK